MKSAAIVGLGQIGSQVARQLGAAGYDVRALCLDAQRDRSDLTDGLQVSHGDRDDSATFNRFVGAGADVLVDTVAFTSVHARQLVARSADLAAAVVISSVAVYQDTLGRSIGNGEPDFGGPLTESNALVPATDRSYGGGKVLVEQVLLSEFAGPVAVLRPAAVSGPGSTHLREWYLVQRVLDGRRVVPLRRAGSRFHPSSTVNVASLVTHCADTGFAGVLNVADPDAPTVREIAELVASTMGHDWHLILAADGPGLSVGDTPWSAEHPIVLDTSTATAAGWEPVTTYRDALPALVQASLAEVGDRAWPEVYPGLAAYPAPQFDYGVEDTWLRELVPPAGPLVAVSPKRCGGHPGVEE